MGDKRGGTSPMHVRFWFCLPVRWSSKWPNIKPELEHQPAEFKMVSLTHLQLTAITTMPDK